MTTVLAACPEPNPTPHPRCCGSEDLCVCHGGHQCTWPHVYTQFDYNLGKPVNAEDANGIVSAGFYDDSLDRPTALTRAINDGTLKNESLFTYDDSARTITTTTDKDAFADAAMKAKAFYDSLGRTYESRQYTDATNYIATQTQFDSLGRAYRTSNPYVNGGTALWTTSAFDALGRVTSGALCEGAVGGHKLPGIG